VRGVWMCVACGCAWRVDVRGVWMCVACGCAWRVDVRMGVRVPSFQLGRSEPS